MIRFGEKEADRSFLVAVAPLVQERLKKLSEFSALTDFFSKDSLDYPVEALLPKKGSRTREDVAAALGSFLERVRALPAFEAAAIEAACVADAERLGWKKGDYFMALRVAVTGKAVTPPLCESMVLLGREKVESRIAEASRRLSNGA
jgi:glutamyl-tRNA synthetase